MRLRAYLITTLLAGAVAAPLFGILRSDSFPISTYPMFASARASEVAISHALAVRTDGERRPLPPSAVANAEVIQAFETVRQALRQGPEATQALCDRIAAGLAHSGGQGGTKRVEIVTDRFDAVSYFKGDTQPLASTVHAQCEVRSP